LVSPRTVSTGATAWVLGVVMLSTAALWHASRTFVEDLAKVAF
jgi:hypothetical protein